ncbi:peptidyl-prolyl cis-trans isomerase [Abyssalbus ytuae]|uniref:Peptidyl-prolyl cis-trans isomerase n=1 Tax=Abyssalbus ytuae TaxID=2926907 RepID=A0A9E6ZP56_9FLAO|nr:peptidyl-prolyl cis-trans isomerase [Abyssalbus ytuae]UOB18304.1 peptidyl-prolyl cis-trans isomerase [Abyssalbus ytuae]
MKLFSLGFIIFFLLNLSVSCEYLKPRKSDEVVAKVGEEYLYKDDFSKIFSDQMSEQDSINLARSFIDSWAIGKLLVKKAQENLNDDKLEELEGLVQEYRTDIYANAYKEILIATSIDTLVTEEELRTFYEENKENFRLNENLIKIRYVGFDRNFEFSPEVKEKIKRFDESDVEDLQNISHQFKSYYLNDTIWIKTSEIVNTINILSTDKFEQNLKKAQFFELTDSLGVYLVVVKDVLERNSIAPLEYVKPIIKQILLNKRRLEFNRKLEKELIDEAYQTKKYEVYE